MNTAIVPVQIQKGEMRLSDFQKAYEEHARPVYRFLLSLTGNENLAEELLQETFYQAFLHIDRFEGRCNLYTWLCQIGKNAWLKECRRNKHYAETSWDDLPMADSNPSPEVLVIQKEQWRYIRDAMEKLAEPYKGVFILHALGNVKLKEIAVIYQKSESWARVTYFRAKQQIMQEVSK